MASSPCTRHRGWLAAAAVVANSALASAQHSALSLADLSLEELSKVRITSVSKRAESWSDAATSVFVITADDIRRSGVTTLPDAMRLAPNLQVAQVYAGSYTVTARGFNGTSATKMLVLIDGRSVYTPLYAGVFWDAQDVVLADVERIEVISGPGGTLWGVNAVNGVINIITRSAQDTQGTLLRADAGNRGANVVARYGGHFGEDGGFRVYFKHYNRNHTQTKSGADVDDAGQKSQVGFRADWQHGRDQFSVQGNAYRGDHGQPAPGAIQLTGVNFALSNIDMSGVNLLARWQRELGNGSSVSVQAYLDQTRRSIPPPFSENLDIADLQFQHTIAVTQQYALVWGGEYRIGHDDVTNMTPFFAFTPAQVDQVWASVFGQGEYSLTDKLRLTLGARVERNDYTGNEFLPTARLAWKPDDDHLLWTAVSRTARAPSRLDHDAFASVPVNIGPYQRIELLGGPQVKSEIANVFELGYRGQPTPDTSVSLTVYRALYDDLRTQELLLTPPVAMAYQASGMRGSVNGIEIWGSYQPYPFWRLSAGFAGLRERFELKPGSGDLQGLANMQDGDPAQTWMLRSAFDLPEHTELDVALRRVSSLHAPGNPNYVPDYVAVDLRLGWQPRPGLEVSLAGQNLFDTAHGELTSVATRTEVGPSVYVQIISRF